MSFAISLAMLVALLYAAFGYLAYREKTAVSRSPAARLLEDLQQPAPSDFGSIRSRLELESEEDFERYRAPAPDESTDPPFLLLCARTCEDEQHGVRMELAYGLHHDRGGGIDSWDFWFAPVHRERWVAAPARFLYRVNPEQGDAWGLLDVPWTDTGAVFSENRIGRVYELGDTELAGYLHQVVEDREIEVANRIGAPVASLTIHSDFADRAALITPPLWRPIGETLERVRSGLPDFLSEASSHRTFGEWFGDNWWNLAALGSLILLALFRAIKGWWAVSVYGYYWICDELERERLEGD